MERRGNPDSPLLDAGEDTNTSVEMTGWVLDISLKLSQSKASGNRVSENIGEGL
jgi:hypothetical protein